MAHNKATCPCCPSNCEADALQCGKGRNYFGEQGGEGGIRREQSAQTERRDWANGREDSRSAHRRMQGNEQGESPLDTGRRVLGGRYHEREFMPGEKPGHHGQGRGQGRGWDRGHGLEQDRGHGIEQDRGHGMEQDRGHGIEQDRGHGRGQGRRQENGWGCGRGFAAKDRLQGQLCACSRYLHYNMGEKAGQARILSALLESGTVTQRELQDILEVRSGSLSEILNKVEADGFIKRSQSESDKRQLEVKLTEAGMEAAIRLTQERGHRSDELFSGLSDEEKQTLEELLNKLLNSWEWPKRQRGHWGGPHGRQFPASGEDGSV